MVMKPVTSHAPISSAGESVMRAMSAETMKMPEPIIEPITRVVALVSPRPFTNPLSLAGAAEMVFASVLKEPRMVVEPAFRPALFACRYFKRNPPRPALVDSADKCVWSVTRA